MPQPQYTLLEWANGVGDAHRAPALISERPPRSLGTQQPRRTQRQSPGVPFCRASPSQMVRTNPKDGDPGDLGQGSVLPWSWSGATESCSQGSPRAEQSPCRRQDCHSVPCFPLRTACPNAPPVGTEGFIVRDVQVSNVRWDFPGFSTSTKAFQAALKDIWPSDQERPLWSVNSILTLHQNRAHSTGRCPFCHQKASLKGEESLRPRADAQLFLHSVCPPHPSSALAADPAPGEGRGTSNTPQC